MTGSTRRPKNGPEGRCYDLLQKPGWNVTKRGWPDFFVWSNDGRFAVVEVKAKKKDKLKKHQEIVMRALVQAGIPCYKYTPDGDFEEIK